MSVALIRGYDSRYSLSDLWGQAFGDDVEFISDMYACGYLNPADIFVLTEDGRLVSALFLPKYDIQFNGSVFPIRLLSCVATDQSARGKGYMSQLISRALELVRSECCGVCVIPVSTELYSFYEKFGFSSAFYLSETIYSLEQVSAGPSLSVDSDWGEDLYSVYFQKYGRDGCVFKSKERFFQAIAEYKHPTQPCDFFRIGTGFAFVQKNVTEVTVREWGGIDSRSLASALAARYHLPIRIQGFPSEGSEVRPIAMLHSFSEDLSRFAASNKLYLNCMYN